MRKSILLTTTFWTLLGFVSAPPQTASAQTVLAAANAASFVKPSQPNGSLTPGGMFEIFGEDIASDGILVADAFPLPRELGGASVEIVSGGVAFSCYVVRTINRSRITALLPSNTPVGEGLLSVTFNESKSAPLEVRIAGHSFGAFTINSGGTGPGILTDPDFRINTLLQPAHSGEAWSLWGTGLGAIAGDDGEGPAPGVLPYDTKVLVGGLEAEVIYAGRSGCCAGIDQIAFIVPDGVAGCYVPLLVVVEGAPSNFASMSVADETGVCSDPAMGFKPSELPQDKVRIGDVHLSRLDLVIGGFPSQTLTLTTDTVFAEFFEMSPAQLAASIGVTEIAVNHACAVFPIANQSGVVVDPARFAAQSVDVGGQLSLRQNDRVETVENEGGFFLRSFGFALPSLMEETAKALQTKEQLGAPAFFEPGPVEVSAVGGADAASFALSLEIPSSLAWTNRAELQDVDRSKPLTLEFQGGDPNGYVRVFGFSGANVDGSSFDGSAFFCQVPGDSTSFKVGPEVLGLLPVSEKIQGFPAGGVGVGHWRMTKSESEDFDWLGMTYSDTSLALVPYR